MCQILICKDGRPKRDDIAEAFSENPDGGGFAWRKDGKIFWRKGLEIKEMARLAKRKPLPYVLHFRLGTVGSGKYLCHPFPVEANVSCRLQGSARRVLFHNGHWFDWQDTALKLLTSTGRIPSGKRWSDSRVLAWLVYCYSERALQFVKGQRVVVFAPDHITLFGEGWIHDKDGTIRANGGRPKVYDYSALGSWKGVYEDEATRREFLDQTIGLK